MKTKLTKFFIGVGFDASDLQALSTNPRESKRQAMEALKRLGDGPTLNPAIIEVELEAPTRFDESEVKIIKVCAKK